MGGYRYGFNGMEKDDEVSGEGNSYTTYYRAYDSRVARWTSLDPLAYKYPSMSPYSSFGNNPLYFVDLRGDSLVAPTSNAQNLLDQVYANGDAKTKAILDNLDASDVIYEIQYNYTTDPDAVGGLTTWESTKSNGQQTIAIRIWVMQNEEENDMALQIFGDEVIHGNQFETGGIGFYVFEDANGTDQTTASGYDFIDETESKIGAINVANQNDAGDNLKSSALAFKEQILDKGKLRNTKALQKFYKKFTGKDGTKYTDIFAVGGDKQQIPGYMIQYDTDAQNNESHLRNQKKDGKIKGYIYQNSGETKVDPVQ